MNDDIEQTPTPEPTPQAEQPQPPPPPPPPPPQRPMPPPPAAPPQRKFNYLIPVSCAVGCLPWLILLGLAFVALIAAASRGVSGDHVALIRVTGTITSGGSGGGPFSDTTAGAEDLVDQLEKARKDDAAKAIVLRINSPGGSAAGSEEVYNEVMRIRRDGKPVYTSMGDVAASGGYFIACASNKIYADASTITGSIGVIFGRSDMTELFKKIGYKVDVVKSGKYKDMGSPARPQTPEERKLIQDMVLGIYDVFVNAVSKGRNMPVSTIKPLADGRIFTGGQAVKLKLIDQIGDLHQTVADAGRAGGISGKPEVVEYGRKGLLGALFDDGADEAASAVEREYARRALRELARPGERVPGLE